MGCLLSMPKPIFLTWNEVLDSHCPITHFFPLHLRLCSQNKNYRALNWKSFKTNFTLLRTARIWCHKLPLACWVVRDLTSCCCYCSGPHEGEYPSIYSRFDVLGLLSLSRDSVPGHLVYATAFALTKRKAMHEPHMERTKGDKGSDDPAISFCLNV